VEGYNAAKREQNVEAVEYFTKAIRIAVMTIGSMGTAASATASWDSIASKLSWLALAAVLRHFSFFHEKVWLVPQNRP
jgi:hypothetical protein